MREIILEPGAVQSPHTLVAEIFAGEEHHGAVAREQLHNVLGPVEIDVIAVGPMQASDGVDVFEFADAMFQFLESRFQFRTWLSFSFAIAGNAE